MPSLVQIETFVTVARLGSFTRAADELGVSRTAASKNVQQLEAKLGVKLFNRTTRVVNLTEIGAAYLDKARAAMAALTLAGEQAAGMAGRATGRLRVAAPLSFSTLYLHEPLAAFQQRHADVRLELDLSDAMTDLIGGGFDVGLRIGTSPDSTLRQRRLTTIRRVLCAAPSYLAHHGVPQEPEDLTRMNCLEYRHLSERTQWVLTRGRSRQTVRVAGDIRANNGEFLAKLAVAGRGVINVPRFIVGDALATGALVQVLPDFEPPAQSLCALYPAGQAVPMKSRVFLDFIARHFAAQPGGDPV